MHYILSKRIHSLLYKHQDQVPLCAATLGEAQWLPPRKQFWASEALRVFSLLCCALPLVVLAISSLVAVPGTS